MKIYELIIISFSLAMDAFSVSICKGINLKFNIKKKAFIISLCFSFFQILMPLLGIFLGNSLNSYFLKYNNLIAFSLLFIVGLNMLKESLIETNSKSNIKNNLDVSELLSLGIATSIDAFSVGLTFSLFKVNLLLALSLIGVITFVLSYIGVILGKKIGNKYQTEAETFGGIVLIIMSLKFLLKHFKIF